MLEGVGRFEEAEASHGQAIALKSDYAKAHNNLGISLQELTRLEEAKVTYRQAVAMKREFSEAHRNFGVLLQDTGRVKEAEGSDSIDLELNKANIHTLAGKKCWRKNCCRH